MKYLSVTVPSGMKYSNLKLISTCKQPYIAQIKSIAQIVRTERRPWVEVSSGAYTVAINFSTDEAYSSLLTNPLDDILREDFLKFDEEPIEDRLSLFSNNSPIFRSNESAEVDLGSSFGDFMPSFAFSFRLFSSSFSVYLRFFSLFSS